MNINYLEDNNLESLKNNIDKIDILNYFPKNYSALHRCATLDYIEILQFFIEEKKISPHLINDLGNSILHEAARNNSIKTIKYLINNYNMNINIQNNDKLTPLHEAAGDFEISKLLIEKGADINSLDSWNRSPIFYALEMQNIELLEYYISQGANLYLKDLDGKDLVLTACSSGYFEIVKLLHEKYKLALDALDGSLYSALHYACENEEGIDLVSYLIEKGLAIEAKDDYGFTPLHVAVDFSIESTVSYLLSKGANKEALTEDDEKPIDFCTNEAIKKLLYA